MNPVRAKTSAAALLCCAAALLTAGRGQAETPDAPPTNPYEGDATWQEATPPAAADGARDASEDATSPNEPTPSSPEPSADSTVAVVPTALDVEPRPVEAEEGAAPTSLAASPAASPETVAAASPAPEMATADRGSGPSAHRVTAIALTGLSFVGMGVGTSYAIQSTSQNRQAAAECTPGCSAAAERLNRQAQQSATVAQVAFAIGLVSLGGAAYLWLTESSAQSSAQSSGQQGSRASTEQPRRDAASASVGWRFDVTAAPGGGSAWLAGSF